MQIFITSQDPVACAHALDDKRVVKMTLESAQLLATALRERYHIETAYRSTHTQHPAAIWARFTTSNTLWLFDHFEALADEYARRFGGTHKSWAQIGRPYRKSVRRWQRTVLTEFPNITPYPNMPTFEAYRRTLRDKWAADTREPKWTNREPPIWGSYKPEDK